jgi:hypothetical protein
MSEESVVEEMVEEPPMSREPPRQILVVKAIAIPSQTEYVLKWVKILMLINAVQYACNSVMFDDLLFQTFAFVVCGVYLPWCGYKSFKLKNKCGITSFVCSQCCISLLGFVTVMSNVSFYVTLIGFCKDCEDIFEAGNTSCIVGITNEYDVTLNGNECGSIPNLVKIITSSLLSAATSVVGFVTIHYIQNPPSQKNQIVAEIVENNIPTLPVSTVSTVSTV